VTVGSNAPAAPQCGDMYAVPTVSERGPILAALIFLMKRHF
jgi:hypothetical protein